MQFMTSPLLESLPHLYHGFGMRTEEDLAGIVFPKQVHGDRVVTFDSPVPETWREEADAVITTVPGMPIGVRTADCLPILVAEGTGRGVAAVHAGWKGMGQGILPKVIKRISEHLQIPPEDLYVAVGPGIGPCCLEVDIPVRDFFEERGRGKLFMACARPGSPDHWWLDLKIMALRQAVASGVREARVDVLPYCTRCEAAYFYSYRREGLAAGRQANYIVLKETEANR